MYVLSALGPSVRVGCTLIGTETAVGGVFVNPPLLYSVTLGPSVRVGCLLIGTATPVGGVFVQPAPHILSNTWALSVGHVATYQYCDTCGWCVCKPAPLILSDTWALSVGHVATYQYRDTCRYKPDKCWSRTYNATRRRGLSVKH